MRERLLTVLGAICLVAVAVLVRSALADDGGGGDDAERSGDAPIVACEPELAEVCDALAADGRIAADPPELELGDEPADDVVGWIAWDPGPSVAGFDAPDRSADAVWTERTGLARATLAVAGRARDLERCTPLTWACLAEEGAAGLAVGVGEPDTAGGLARIEPIARAATDGGDTAALPGSLPALLRGPPQGQTGVVADATRLVTRPGEVAVVVGPAGLLERTADTERGRAAGIDVRSPDGDPAVATVVLATHDHTPDDLCAALGDEADAALADLGLTVACDADPMDDVRSGFLFQVKETT